MHGGGEGKILYCSQGQYRIEGGGLFYLEARGNTDM